MKRLWSTREFVVGQRIRARKLDRRRRSAPEQRAGSDTRPSWRQLPRFGQHEVSLPAPKALKLFDEPDETLEYCNKLMTYLTRPGTRVFLDLDGVQDFTTDALLLIRTVMDSPSRARQTQVRGNLPSDPSVAAEFKASGFFAGFAKPPADLPEAKGMMLKKSSDMVYSKVAAELVDFSMKHGAVEKKCANACSQNLVELMTNTHNHAGNRRRVRRSRNFNFIDLGVGILSSAPARNLLQKTGVSLLSYGRARLLIDVFRGTVGSATGKPGRGLGLPRMKKDAENGQLLNLQVLTADVVGSIDDLNFRSTRRPLRGTAFHWRTSHEGGQQ